MASDDSVIFVDVVPRLDDSETEKSVEKLRDKFKRGAQGTGKAISDVLHSELAQELGRQLEPVARDAGTKLAKELGTGIHDQLSDVLADVGIDFDGVIDKTHDVADGIGKIHDSVKAIKQGDVAGGLGGVAKSLKDIAGDNAASDVLGNISEKASPLQDRFKDLKGSVHDTVADFKDLAGNSGRISGALTAISEAAGPLAAALLSVEEIDKLSESLNNRAGQTIAPRGGIVGSPFWLWNQGNKALDQGSWDPLNPFKVKPTGPPPKPAAPYAPAPGLPGLLMPGEMAPSGPSVGGIPIPGVTAAPDSKRGGNRMHPTDWGSGGPGGSYTQDQAAAAIIGAAKSRGLNQEQTLAALSVGLLETNLGSNPMTNVAQNQSGTVVQGLFQQDSSYSKYFGGGSRTDPGGAARGFVDQYIARGGLSKDPYQAAVDVQVGTYGPGYVRSFRNRAMDFYTRNGGGGGGPAQAAYGMFAGVPSPGGTSPMGYSIPGTGSGGYMPAGYGGLGPGEMSPSQANSYSPVQQQQTGSGKGFGLTGGGLIGMAEKAGTMGAALGGMGGGGIAMQIGEQEMNLAVQQGGKMAAALVSAPMETLGLKGGQMGAPSVGSGGWMHKLVGGMVGQMTNSSNIAGATQPPKQAGDKEDPGAGGQSQGAGGQGGKGGPTGHKDDPMHVSVVPPAGGSSPLGSMTSGANATSAMSALPA